MMASRMESLVHLLRSISVPLKLVMVVPFTSVATKVTSSSVRVIRSW